jgi:hypothetical protein
MRRVPWWSAMVAALEVGRVGLGVSALVVPAVLTRVWVGDRASRMIEVRVLCRALGARDLVLGVAPLLTVRRSHAITGATRGWVLGAACADTGDALATALCWGSLPAKGRRMVLAASLGAAATGFAAYALS